MGVLKSPHPSRVWRVSRTIVVKFGKCTLNGIEAFVKIKFLRRCQHRQLGNLGYWTAAPPHTHIRFSRNNRTKFGAAILNYPKGFWNNLFFLIRWQHWQPVVLEQRTTSRVSRLSRNIQFMPSLLGSLNGSRTFAEQKFIFLSVAWSSKMQRVSLIITRDADVTKPPYRIPLASETSVFQQSKNCGHSRSGSPTYGPRDYPSQRHCFPENIL